jgi:sortase A
MNKLLLLKRVFISAAFIAAFLIGVNIFFTFNPYTNTFEIARGQETTTDNNKKLPNTSAASTSIEDEDFVISIPSIDLNHDIKYNVDPRDKDIYLPVLDKYVAHGMFTALPSTEDGRVYLYAHSKVASKGITPEGGYFSHLHEVKKGELIYIYYKGDKYTYKVRDKIIVEPTRVDIYTGESDKPEVALQTCFPPGTTKNRLIVFADLVSVK